MIAILVIQCVWRWQTASPHASLHLTHHFSRSQTNLLLSSPIKYPTCQHFPLLHLLTFLHHRQHFQISLRLGLQEICKILLTVPTSNPAPILYPPGSSKNVHQFSSSSQAINLISPSQETHLGQDQLSNYTPDIQPLSHIQNHWTSSNQD